MGRMGDMGREIWNKDGPIESWAKGWVKGQARVGGPKDPWVREAGWGEIGLRVKMGDQGVNRVEIGNEGWGSRMTIEDKDGEGRGGKGQRGGRSQKGEWMQGVGTKVGRGEGYPKG